MDVASVVAAVGSFVVSERVIKAKATVVLCALGIVAYDLTLLSTDPISLRVYRGPALLGLAFICTAYSLRTWRRNNCACDELLFLPDTMYYKIAYRANGGVRNMPLNLRTTLETSSSLKDIKDQSEDSLIADDSSYSVKETEIIPLSIDPTLEKNNMNRVEHSRVKTFICRRRRNHSSDHNATESTHTWPRASNLQCNEESISSSQPRGFIRLFFSKPALETNEYSPSGPTVASAGLDLLLPVLMNFHLFMMASRSGRKMETSSTAPSSDNIKDTDTSSTISNTHVGLVYFTQPLHTTNGSSISMSYTFLNEQHETEFNINHVPSIPPQVLPIIFLSILLLRSIFPRQGRIRFWKAISSSIRAPFQSIDFRDAFLAEVLTSMTRTLQDFFFAFFYYISTMYGIIFGDLNIINSGSSLQHNRLLHNFVLPTVALLPLFIRYLQSLRQAYDDQRRWPHLGNAFKYLTATLIIVYAMNHAEDSNENNESYDPLLSTKNSKTLLRSRLWVLAFIAAVIYQLYWDVVFDWELFEFNFTQESFCNVDRNDGEFSDDIESASLISSRKPSSSSHSSIYNIFSVVFTWHKLQLRSKRLFKTKSFYLKIFFINIFLRFTWMLAFIPAFYVNSETGDIVHTNSVDLGSAVGFALSIAELTRRCLWGILKVEVETIKMIDPEFKKDSLWNSGKKVDYSCRLFCKIKNSSSAFASSTIKRPREKSTMHADVIILEAYKGDDLSTNEAQTDQDEVPLTKSYNFVKSPMLRSPEVKSKGAPPALPLISTEYMRKTAHRMLVRRLFILELSLWVFAYIALALWARYVNA